MGFLERQKEKKRIQDGGAAPADQPKEKKESIFKKEKATKPEKKAEIKTKVPPKREKPPKQKKEKPPKPPKKVININSENHIKPKRDIGKKVMRVVLWIMLSFVFVRGVADILKPDPTNEMQRITESFIAEQKSLKDLDFELQSFAQNFAKEYLTYEKEKLSDYKKRIGPYAIKNLAIGMDTDFKNTATATYVQAYKAEQYGNNQYDIYVMATVEYPIPQTGIKEITIDIERHNAYLKIPVRVLADGKYIVEDLPLFVAPPVGYKYEPTAFEGKEADPVIKGEIEVVLSNFLSAYYQENETRIEYFLHANAEKGEFKGLENRFTFLKINTLHTYIDPANPNRYLCTLEIAIKDRNEQQLIQRFNILILRDGTRYYVAEMDTKAASIKYNFKQ